MLNEIEKEKLQTLLNDNILLGAVEKVFKKISEDNLPNVNEFNNDEVLGSKLRAYNIAKNIIDQSFMQLQTYKKFKSHAEGLNPGR